MQAIIEGTPDQIRQAEQLTGSTAVPVVMSQTGAVANLNDGPVILEHLSRQMDLTANEVTPWEDLDLEAQEEIALLTADSAPWVMDGKLHDTAAEDLSEGDQKEAAETRLNPERRPRDETEGGTTMKPATDANGPCPEAVKTAQELARRLGSHHEPSSRCAVILAGSRAVGTHGPASDTDLIVVPTWDQWPGPGPAYNAERIARRFQKGAGRTPVAFDPNGTDIGVCETWEANCRHWDRIETQEGDDCWSTGEGGEEHNEGLVNLVLAPPGLIGRDLTEANAFIFADTGEILAKALMHVRAVTIGPWPEDAREGMALHILDSRMFATVPNGNYGRYDFPHRGPSKQKTLPEKEPEPIAPEPEEIADAIARTAEETAELVANSPVEDGIKREIINRLNRMAILADQAADEGARSSLDYDEYPQVSEWDDDLPF